MYHIHYYASSRDCDGPLEIWHDHVPDPEVPAMNMVDPDDPMDIAMNYVMPSAFHVPDPFAGGTVSITIDVDYDGRYVVTSSRRTDEGYSAESWTVCDCDDFEEGSRQRDHFAESAGY